MADKKSIYNMDMKEFRGLLKSFGKTLYGKTIFLIAYFVPGLLFLAIIGLSICGFIMANEMLTNAIVILLACFVISFLAGNMYYYRELRVFAEKR